MSNILKDLIKRALKEADDAAMKKSALGMAMYGKKAKMKEAEITAGEGNTKFKLKVDVSNPQSETKLGVRLQLTPKEGLLEPDTKDTLEAAIMKKLNTSLGQYDIQVSKDTDVPREDVIGFFIPLSQLKNLIVKSLTGSAPVAEVQAPEPEGKKMNEVILNEMRVRDLNEISKVVMKEDFYAFINAGNNVLRSLEGSGRSVQEAKKYLAYLVKHNIM